jgi:VWFA-related protein
MQICWGRYISLQGTKQMMKMIVRKARLNKVMCISAHEHLWTTMRSVLVCIPSHICMVAVVILIAPPVTAQSQNLPSAQFDSSNDYIIKVNANLVILNATVLNRNNALVSGLQKTDFRIYEDHVLQQIKNFSHEDIPVTVGIVIDNSASMDPKRADVISAALLFAQSSNPQDQMFVVNFNDHVHFGLPKEMLFTDRQDQLQLALSSIRAIGKTSLYDGIATALDHLMQGNCDKKVLILISDGGDNASKHSLAKVIDMAKHSAAIIYTIGIFDEQDEDKNLSVLNRFAKETGGEAFFPESSKEIASICEKIARDIRNQYTLSYVPKTSKQDGEYRTLDVTASAPRRGRLSVRTRAGYSVPLMLPPTKSGDGHDFHN